MTNIKNVNYKYIQYTPAFKSRIEATNPIEDENIPKEIKVLLEKVKLSKTYKEYWETLNNYAKLPNSVQITGDTIKNKSYYVKSAAQADIDYLKTVLQGLEKRNLYIAPKYIDSSLSKEGFGVAVLKINGTDSGNLIPLNNGYNLLSDEAKKEAYNHIKKLTKLGIVNKKMLDNTSFKITPDKPHRIICTDWNTLYPLGTDSESERQEIINQVFKILFNPNKL